MPQENQPNLFNDLSFDQTAKMHIRSMAGWAMTVVVVAVIGYIISVYSLFAGGSTSTQSFYSQMMYSDNSEMSRIISLVVIGVGLIINFFLYRFASQARSGLDGLSQQQISRSFGNLKVYFMIISILFVVFFVIVLLGFVLYATAER